MVPLFSVYLQQIQNEARGKETAGNGVKLTLLMIEAQQGGRRMSLRDKRIAVIGVGGVGGYLSGMLLQQFPHVTLVARGERGRAIKERGLVLHSGYKGEKTGRPERVVSEVRLLEPQDYIFICVKNYSLEVVCRDLAASGAVADETVIIPVMNGVDAADRVRDLLRLEESGSDPDRPGESANAAGLTAEGRGAECRPGEGGSTLCTEEGAGGSASRKAVVVDSLIYIVSFSRPDFSIEQQGKFANLRIGIQNADARQQEKVAEVSRILSEADIDHETAADIRREVWKKYILNCAYNVETAYYDDPIGRLRDDPVKAKEYEQLVREACATAEAEGIGIPQDHAETVIRKFYNDYGDDATSSLQRDVHAGRQSELETFSGYLVREARRLGVPVPVSERMYEGLREKERTAAGGIS